MNLNVDIYSFYSSKSTISIVFLFYSILIINYSKRSKNIIHRWIQSKLSNFLSWHICRR